MTNGYIRVAAVSPRHRVADVQFNVDEIIKSMHELNDKGVKIAVFPELCISGYTCGDLFHNAALIEASKEGLQRIADESKNLDLHVIVGLPVRQSQALYNCAAVVRGGEIDLVKKAYLPNYNEFYERRWFAPSDELDTHRIFESHGIRFGIEVCEDLWVTVPPSCSLALSGAQVIFNLSASNALIGKHAYLIDLIRQQSARCICGYVYASAGFGESTTDTVFLPQTIIAENGTMLCENDYEDFTQPSVAIADIDVEAIDRDRMHITSFADCARNLSLLHYDDGTIGGYGPVDLSCIPEYRSVNPTPFVPNSDGQIDIRCREITTIQECGLATRLKAVGSNRLVVGISGGLDSTLALLVAVNAVRRLKGDVKDIIAVTMPGFGTTGRTYQNALKLMEKLGVTILEIPIADAVMQHFKDIGQDPEKHDVTYENSQARERTQILMDLANKYGGMVLGTGDLSELALGWATYNGDHISMYGVNAGVPKTLVRYLVRWYSMRSEDAELRATLSDIIDTPISPELTPADAEGNIKQKTEELVGPYELHDFFLYYMLRYGFSPKRVYLLAVKAFDGQFDREIILKWLRVFYRRFFTQQFKRSCLPDGPKVGSVCLSPRGDWRMPSDASMRLWIAEVDSI